MLIIIVDNMVTSIPTGRSQPHKEMAFHWSCAQYKDKAAKSGDGLKPSAACAEMASDRSGSCLSSEGSGKDFQVS